MPAPTKQRRSRRRPQPKPAVPDLHSQLEELLGAVWGAEANWRWDDRLDLALKVRRPDGQ
ncbi:MAG TPA: hypothetical protein VK131_03635 [Candidatus Acidoferrales bacterium]|nr:hypothetical protein [Candidatus Acidoferrales bacterium]